MIHPPDHLQTCKRGLTRFHNICLFKHLFTIVFLILLTLNLACMSAGDCHLVCGGLLGVGHDALVGQPVHVAVEQRLEEADDVVVEEEEHHQSNGHHDLRHRPKLYTDEDTAETYLQ